MINKTLWIARHGNRWDFVYPEWFNHAPRRYDPPLSEDGKIQAKQLANRLKQEKIEHLVVSPFLRTIQTGYIIAETLNLTMKLEAGLSEWHNPQWMSEKPETHPKQELENIYPRIDWSYSSQVFPEYPETQAKVFQRMEAIIRILTQKFPDNLLLVGHAISVEGIVKSIMGKDVEVNTSLCSLTKLVYDQDLGWQLVLNGDTSFL